MKEYTDEDGVLAIPQSASEFSFPFNPYSIQVDFMRNLFQVCEQSKFGIFQSPTGTGKTLSLLCGALTWLYRDQDRQKFGIFTNKGDEPKWISDQKREKRFKERRQAVHEIQQEFDLWEKEIRKFEVKNAGISRRHLFTKNNKRVLTGQEKSSAEGPVNNDIADELLEAYKSGDELADDKNQSEVERWLQCYKEGKIYHGPDDSGGKNDPLSVFKEKHGFQIPPLPSNRKVIYTSRTHSQLKQTIKELKKTKFWIENKIHSVTAGSRMQLCINSELKGSCKTTAQLNEKCVEMQKASTKKTNKCPYLHKEYTPTLNFVESTRGDVMDIEDLVSAGKKLETCPYYGARQAIQSAQIVFIPYNLLLVADSRKALGLDLENSIVIVDEAHNLVDTICSSQGSSLTLEIAKRGLELVKSYFNRYWNRLNGQNVVYIRQLMTLLKSICRFLENKIKLKLSEYNNGSSGQSPTEKLESNKSTKVEEKTKGMDPNQLIHAIKVESINLYKLAKFIRISQLSHKLMMFNDRINIENSVSTANTKKRVNGSISIIEARKHNNVDINGNGNPMDSRGSVAQISALSAMTSVESFINALSSSITESSRVFIKIERSDNGETNKSGIPEIPSEKQFTAELKYVLMDPYDSFKETSELPRAVVLAGGTMNPIEDVVLQLGLETAENKDFSSRSSNTNVENASPSDSLAKLKPKKLFVFECPHVVPKKNISATVLGYGVHNTEINLSFAGQNNSSTVQSVGESLLRVLGLIPSGVVVFFPSYHFLYKAYEQWKKSGILSRIEAAKPVFCEPRPENKSSIDVYKSGSDSALSKSTSFGNKSNTGSNQKFSSAEILVQYKAAIGNRGGAVLLAVVSGNMSEGIDFSDDLARAVVMVGVPYPNLTSEELSEKIRYYQQKHTPKKSNAQNSVGPASKPINSEPKPNQNSIQAFKMNHVGFDFYENLCMRAVNQSIGRAIRHINDYAMIILMDKRYSSPSIVKKLPGWLVGDSATPSITLNGNRSEQSNTYKSMLSPKNLDTCLEEVSHFFSDKA